MKRVPLYSRSHRPTPIAETPAAPADAGARATETPRRRGMAFVVRHERRLWALLHHRPGGRVLVVGADLPRQAAADDGADRRRHPPVDRGKAARLAGLARLRRDHSVGRSRRRPDDRRRRWQRFQAGRRHRRARRRHRRRHHRQRHDPHQPACRQRRQEDPRHFHGRVGIGRHDRRHAARERPRRAAGEDDSRRPRGCDDALYRRPRAGRPGAGRRLSVRHRAIGVRGRRFRAEASVPLARGAADAHQPDPVRCRGQPRQLGRVLS